jgi:hypothetical protein
MKILVSFDSSPTEHMKYHILVSYTSIKILYQDSNKMSIKFSNYINSFLQDNLCKITEKLIYIAESIGISKNLIKKEKIR